MTPLQAFFTGLLIGAVLGAIAMRARMLAKFDARLRHMDEHVARHEATIQSMERILNRKPTIPEPNYAALGIDDPEGRN